MIQMIKKDTVRIYAGKHTCQECGAILIINNFDDSYPNHENEPIFCPNCSAHIGDLRTSGYPYVEDTQKPKD